MTDLVFAGKAAGGPLNSDAMPQNYDLVMYRGDTFTIFFTITISGTPVSLSGSTVRAHLKSNYEDRSPLPFTCTITGTPGQVRMSMPAGTTSNLIPGSYIYDLEVTDAGGSVRTYLAGDVTVENDVTS